MARLPTSLHGPRRIQSFHFFHCILDPVSDSEYEEILVDEYQDSNEVQETLIRLLSRERFGTPNVFMVGDVKQSIYKFRPRSPHTL